MKKEIIESLLNLDASLMDAVSMIEKKSSGFCVIADNNKLIGILTDGDIRRALLKGFKMDSKCIDFCNKSPITVTQNTNQSELITLLSKFKFLPLIDEEGLIIDVINNREDIFIPICEPNLCGNEFQYLSDAFTSGWISSQGKYISAFEESFSKFTKSKYSLTTSNGTTALHLILEALGISEGDEVIVPNLTFAATINSIIHAGANPVLVDVNPRTYGLDIDLIKNNITDKTKCIMLVHLYGYPIDIDNILDFAKHNNLLVIEDCAEALGSYVRNNHVGIKSDASAFSFFANKLISTGEGGMAVFKEKNIYEKAKVMRDHGMNKNKKYWHKYIGFNYRMTNMQASIGFAQLENIEKFINAKRKIADLYKKYLNPIKDYVIFPEDPLYGKNSYWLFSIYLKQNYDIDKIIKFLREYGIDSRRFFTPLNFMEIYFSYSKCDNYKNSIDLYENSICLPSSTNLTELQISYISKKLIDTIMDFK